jgi:hypothetical protein
MLQSRLKPRRLWDFIAYFPADSQDSTITRKLLRVHHRRFDKLFFCELTPSSSPRIHKTVRALQCECAFRQASAATRG